MTIDDHIGYSVFAFLVPIAATLAMFLASLLKSLGVISANPLKYLPHLVLLFTIAVTPIISAGTPTLRKSLTVLGGVVGIWLIAVWLSSEGQRWISHKSPHTR